MMGRFMGGVQAERFCGSKRSPIEIKALFKTPLKTAVGPAWLNVAHRREVQTCPKQRRFRSRPRRPEVNPHQMKSRFYVGAAVFVILLNVAGFAPSLIDQSRRVAPPTWLMTAHAALAGAWLLFFLIETTLVATRRTAIHRRLGVAGPFIAFAMIAVGALTVIDLSRRGYDLSGDLARAAFAPGSHRWPGKNSPP